MLIATEVKMSCGIVNTLNIIIVVLRKELVLYALTRLVSTDLCFMQLFNVMKINCIWEVTF